MNEHDIETGTHIDDVEIVDLEDQPQRARKWQFWLRRSLPIGTILGGIALFWLLWPTIVTIVPHPPETIPDVPPPQQFYSHVQIQDNLLFLISTVKNGSSPQGIIEAVRLDTGTHLWSLQDTIDTPYNVTITDTTMYIAARGELKAIHMRDRSVLWSYPHAGSIQAHQRDTLLYTSSDGSNTVTALHANTGRMLWMRKNAIVQHYTDDIVYLSRNNNTRIEAVRIHDGTVLWQQNCSFRDYVNFVDGIIVCNNALPSSAGQVPSVMLLRMSDGSELLPLDPRFRVETIRDSVVYVYDFQKEYLVALRLNDGQQLWRVPYEQSMNVKFVRSTLYLYSQNLSADELIALNAADGRELWRHTAPGRSSIRWGEDTFYLYSYQEPSFTAIQASDGTEIWHYQGSGYLSPLIQEISDGIVYLNTPHSSNILALQADNGQKIWEFDTGTSELNILAEQKVGNQLLVWSSNKGVVDALRPFNGTRIWQYQARYH